MVAIEFAAPGEAGPERDGHFARRTDHMRLMPVDGAAVLLLAVVFDRGLVVLGSGALHPLAVDLHKNARRRFHQAISWSVSFFTSSTAFSAMRQTFNSAHLVR